MSDQQERQMPPVSGDDRAPSIGALLREEREARGESVADAAHALKLTQRQVEAMESERFDLLPGAAFVRGFLRNYSRHLGVETEALIAALVISPEAPQSSRLAPASHVSAPVMPGSSFSRKSYAPAVLVLVAISLCFVMALGWYFDWFNVANELSPVNEPVAVENHAAPAPAISDVAPPVSVVVVPDAPAASPSATGISSTPVVGVDGTTVGGLSTPVGVGPEVVLPVVATLPSVAGTAPVVPPAPVVAPVAGGLPLQNALVFRLKEASWIQVRDRDGKTLFSGTDAAGTSRTVQGNPPFAVVVGNALQVTLEFNGKPVNMTPYIQTGVARVTVE